MRKVRVLASDDADLDELRLLLFRNGFVAEVTHENAGERAVQEFRQSRENSRQPAEEARRESGQWYKRLFEESKDGVYIVTPTGGFLEVNPAFVRMHGYESREEMLGVSSRELYLDPEDKLRFDRLMQRDGYVQDFAFRARRRDGKTLELVETAAILRDESGGVRAYQGMVRDLTALRKLEQRLIQAQRMEAVATLAGGIAHDFNNILSMILAYSSLFRGDGATTPELQRDAAAVIEKAVMRGADIVRQMLTFARKADAHCGPMDVNSMVKEMVKMLREAFPKTIEFAQDLAADIPPVTADATQFHQALLNVCLNARDAMPSGGRLTLRTGLEGGSEVRRHFGEADAGQYVVIQISDTGAGMPPETIQRIFDPFFTTKGPERGGGLGLAVVYGVMASHRGFVRVESEVGRGSDFFLHFPIQEQPQAMPRVEPPEVPAAGGGQELLLLVEDEEPVLKFLDSACRAMGYRTLLARDGNEALGMFERHANGISIVISDMDLPKIPGHKLIARMRQIRPALPAILTTGYMEPELMDEMDNTGVNEVLRKPYRPGDLLRLIRGLLDSAKPGAPGS